MQLRDADSTFEEGAGVDAARGVALKVDMVAVDVVAMGAKKMVESELEERRARRVCCGDRADTGPAIWVPIKTKTRWQGLPATASDVGTASSWLAGLDLDLAGLRRGAPGDAHGQYAVAAVGGAGLAVEILRKAERVHKL